MHKLVNMDAQIGCEFHGAWRALVFLSRMGPHDEQGQRFSVALVSGEGV